MSKQGYMPPAKTVEWETPQAFFDRLDAEFEFTLDAAANHDNAKCEAYYDIEMDGLAKSWQNHCVWCNPPYGGRVLAGWVRKAHAESKTCPHPIVMLLPARTDVKWWHDCAMQADEVRFVKGRLKFTGGKHSATFPSVVVVFRSILTRRDGAPRFSSMPARL